jgi:hypothetical protein
MIFVLEIPIIKSKEKKSGEDATTLIFGKERRVSKIFN